MAADGNSRAPPPGATASGPDEHAEVLDRQRHATVETLATIDRWDDPTVLGFLFPADEADLAALGDEAKNSRLWAGIHFPIDNEMGALGGSMIGRLVAARAREEDAG